MAGPAYYSADVNMAQNEDWIVPFVFGTATQADLSDFVPIDLTGSVLKMQIRESEQDHEATVAVWSPDGGILITDALNGAFTVTITRSQIIRLAPGIYVTDMIRINANAYWERLWEGTATVVQGTTR